MFYRFFLLFQKTDIAAAFLPIIPALINRIHFSHGLERGQWVVMMKRPSLSATGSGLLAPFTWDVWLLTILSLLVVGPIIYLLVLVKVRLCPGEPQNERYPLPSCVWFVYGAMLKQGSLLNPVSGKRQIFLIAIKKKKSYAPVKPTALLKYLYSMTKKGFMFLPICVFKTVCY